jgi:hypothetical protein
VKEESLADAIWTPDFPMKLLQTEDSSSAVISWSSGESKNCTYSLSPA